MYVCEYYVNFSQVERRFCRYLLIDQVLSELGITRFGRNAHMVFLKGIPINFRKIDGKRDMNGVTRSYGGKVQTVREL